MTHSGDGSGWVPTVPEDNAPINEGAQEIRDLRAGLKIRVDKEHSSLTTASGGGEHKKGAGRAYFTTVAPTQKPDGATVLDTTANSDDGRLFVNSTAGSEWQKVWTGDAWDWVKVVGSMIVANAVTYGHVTTITTGALGRVSIGTYTFTDATIAEDVVLGWQPDFIFACGVTTAGAAEGSRSRWKMAAHANYGGRGVDDNGYTGFASIAATGFTVSTQSIVTTHAYAYIAVSLWDD